MNSPEIPEQLKVPRGEELIFKAHAVGVQIYLWQAGADGRSTWTFKAPQADLYDENGLAIGTHFAGPTWRLKDGSEVAGKVAAKADSPDPAAIPWLLLTVTGRLGSGALSRASSIHRVNTRGGQPPKAAGTSEGEEARVEYSADYYFYAPRL